MSKDWEDEDLEWRIRYVVIWFKDDGRGNLIRDLFSLWPSERKIPVGWREVFEGTKEQCFDYIKKIWKQDWPVPLSIGGILKNVAGFTWKEIVRYKNLKISIGEGK